MVIARREDVPRVFPKIRETRYLHHEFRDALGQIASVLKYGGLAQPAAH